MREIGEKVGVPYHWVRKVIVHSKIPRMHRADYMKWRPTEQEKLESIRLYSMDKRGVQYIASYFKTSQNLVAKYFKEWGVPKISRSDLQVSNRLHYGNTKGFSGKTHTSKSKEQIAKSLLGNTNRKSPEPKSQSIKTCVGAVQGSFEVAFLQQCINNGSQLPATGSSVQTPYGLYYPDFEYPENFVEIKSPFTWDICQGLRENAKGVKTDIQHRKIKWVDKNVKPVKIFVMEEKNTQPLFKQAIQNKSLVYDNIIWKRGKYYKVEPLHLS